MIIDDQDRTWRTCDGATQPGGFCKGPDARAALVGAGYGGDPCSGVIYDFGRSVVRIRAMARGRRADQEAAGVLSRKRVRTVQRDLEIWRSEQALEFGGLSGSLAVVGACRSRAGDGRGLTGLPLRLRMRCTTSPSTQLAPIEPVISGALLCSVALRL